MHELKVIWKIDFGDGFKAITSERVAPAAVKGQHVEQQTEEEHVQLSKEVEGKS